MRTAFIISILVSIILTGCSGSTRINVTSPSLETDAHLSTLNESGSGHQGQFLNWGIWQLEIARDGSSFAIIPERYGNGTWGLHLNVVKMLEVDPCTNCIKISNVHALPDGDVSLDISITNPWDNAAYTGFDVRGIIMFPASQYIADEELREQANMVPLGKWRYRIPTIDKGDAVLMNPDGWTQVWAPDLEPKDWDYEVQQNWDITKYYPGKYASGEELGTVNAYRWFYSNENRHMFEFGKTVTRTYIIRPPASGPIQASYAVYAHWAPPANNPVINPVTDFGPDANAPLPYEFWVTQEQVIDPDAPVAENAKYIHWHVKGWNLENFPLRATCTDLLYNNGTSDLELHSCGEPDCYGMPGFDISGYGLLPNGYPGEWPFLFGIGIMNPENDVKYVAREFVIKTIEFGEKDGEW